MSARKAMRRPKALSRVETDRRSRALAQAHGVPLEIVYQLEAARSAVRAAITSARDAKTRCPHEQLAGEIEEAIDGLEDILTEYLTPDLRTFDIENPLCNQRNVQSPILPES